MPGTVAADATVGDLASELLKYPAQLTGLPPDFISANSIIITHHEQELSSNNELSDVGVCAEALLSYGVKEFQLIPTGVYKRGAWRQSSLDWNYHIPSGHHDIMNLMVQQTRNNLPEMYINNDTIIHFTFVFDNTTQPFSPQMPAFLRVFGVSLTNEFDFEVNGKVCLVERSSLQKDRRFDYDSYRNADDIINKEIAIYCKRGHFTRYTHLKFEIDVRVIAGAPQNIVSFGTPDMSVRVKVPIDVTFLLHDVTPRL